MSACNSCDAPMVWARTISGKAIPLDATPEGAPALFPDGNLEDTGRTFSYRGREQMVVRNVPPSPGRMRSHFVSCPNRAQHRRAR